MAPPGFGLLTSGSQRLYSWWTAKSTRDQLLENLDEAKLFEEWEDSAYQLDEVSGLDLWYIPPLSKLMYSSILTI
jgi:TAG lipase / lysophosphatidylethanolamine acyltransferase